MTILYLIITFILCGIVNTRQIGLIADYIFTYEPPIDESSITTITFENTSSCKACICAAFMSTTDYIAINCYKDNNTCSLFTSLVNIIGMISSENNSMYILSYVPMSMIPEDDSMDSSSTTTTTLTSIVSFTTTTASSATATSASVDITNHISAVSASPVSILTVTTRTITATTMHAVITTTSRSTTTTSTTGRCRVRFGPFCISYW